MERVERARILVLDDSEVVREFVRLVLERAGHEVIALGSPFGFSNVLRRQQPDIALVDWSMPGLEGPRLVELVVQKEVVGRCKILLFSDRSPEELAAQAARCGAAGSVPKTTDPARFLASLSPFLTTIRR